jgi:hypothetical protein
VQNETQAEEGLKEHLLVFNPVEVKWRRSLNSSQEIICDLRYDMSDKQI